LIDSIRFDSVIAQKLNNNVLYCTVLYP